jgi:peptide/nickel transport system substrate-binding protein
VTYANFNESLGFDPVRALGATRSGDSAQFNAIFDSLTYYDLQTGAMRAEIADSITSTDGLVWLLKVRPNVKFSDGTTLDAQAVQINWQRLADPKNGSGSASAAQTVQSMSVVDPLTLKVTLTAVNGQFPRLVAERMAFIASPTALAKEGADFINAPVGAGPFLFKEWVRDDHLTLVRNPSYWNTPRPYLDQVIVREIPDDEQRYNTLKTGGIDFAESGINPAYGVRGKQDGLSVNTFVPSGGLGLLFNESKPPFDDVRVRKAVALAMDLNGTNQAVYSGANLLPTTFFPETSPFYDASLVRPEATGPDLTQAQSLIDQYGKPVKFTLLSTTVTKSLFEYVQALLSKLKNVSTSIEIITPAQSVPRQSAGDFDVSSFAFTNLDPEPLLYDRFHSGLSTNWGRYASSDMDKALETGRSTLDPNARRQAYITAQQVMNRDVPVVFLGRFIQSDIYNGKKIQALEHTNAGPMWDRMWIK